MKIVIITDGAPSDQQDAVTEFLKKQGVGYWHWIANAWLVQTSKRINLTEWRDAIKPLCPGISALLFSFEDTDDWSVLADRKSFEWLVKHF